MTAVLLTSFVIIAIIAYVTYQKQTKMLSEGKIIKRDHAFYENAEDFEIATGKDNLITEELGVIDYNEMGVSMKDRQLHIAIYSLGVLRVNTHFAARKEGVCRC